MRLADRFGTLVPKSLFWRLVSVWVLCFVVIRLFSMADISQRSDDVFLRVMAGTEARYMALHMRLLAGEPRRMRSEFIRQLGRDKELWVRAMNTPPMLPEENSPLSREMAEQLRVFLERSGLNAVSVRASVQSLPRAEFDASRWHSRGPAERTLNRKNDTFELSVLGADRAAQTQAAVEFFPGEWVHLVHNVDVLPKTVLYFSLMRLLTESVVMIILALSTLMWIVRPLQTLAQATEAFGRDMNTPPLPENVGSSEIRNAARAFNSMRERLVSFVRQRTTLLAAVSHDLRTPLTRMRLRLEAMEDERLRSALQADVDEVQQSLDQIIGMVRTLNAADPENPDRVDFMALLESMVEDMQDMGQAVTLHGEVPGCFWLAPTLTRRCVHNVLSNAVRYGGEAEVHASLAEGFIRLDVLDKGPGIPEDRQEMVFEPFYRLDASRNLKTGGYGLGLAIARALARRYGGDVRLQNRPEGGLCTTITLRADPVTA